MTRIFIILALSCSAVNVDALVLNQEERSENTIAVTGMNSMQTKAVKVIAEGIKRRVEKAAAGELVSHNEAGHSDVHEVLEDARKYLVDKRKQIRAYRNSQRANRTKGHHLKVGGETCGGWCMAGIIIDSLFIVGDMGGMGCGPLAMLVWWVQGIVVLAVDQGLSLDDAIFVLVQQITTIGYGSHGPKTAGMKIWHALHSVVGTTMAAEPTNKIITKFTANMIKGVETAVNNKPPLVKKLAASLPLALTIIATTFGYSFDLKEGLGYDSYAKALLDSFYMTLFSLTTVGYGDYNPSTTTGKLLSLPVMMYGTNLFSLTYGGDSALDSAIGEDTSLEYFTCGK